MPMCAHLFRASAVRPVIRFKETDRKVSGCSQSGVFLIHSMYLTNACMFSNRLKALSIAGSKVQELTDSTLAVDKQWSCSQYEHDRDIASRPRVLGPGFVLAL